MIITHREILQDLDDIQELSSCEGTGAIISRIVSQLKFRILSCGMMRDT
jgi:hypothetical protein